MTTITLPPLPHLPLGGRILRAQITEIIKARDLEVARLVLEGAANVCYDQRGNWSVEGVGQVALENAGDAINAIGVKHHE
jgi:hypothetical protein